MIAGDSKIWIMALFLLASYVYKAIKKKKERDKLVSENQDIEENAGESSWGMEELISEFEQSYKASNSQDVFQEEVFEKEPVNSDSAPIAEVEPQIEKKKVKVDSYTESEANAYGNTKAKGKKSEPTVMSTDTEDDFSLRDMVIGKVILDRPEY